MLVYSYCGVYIVVVCGGAGGGGHDGQSSDDGQGSSPGPQITSAARRHAGRGRRPLLHLSATFPHRGSLPDSQVIVTPFCIMALDQSRR